MTAESIFQEIRQALSGRPGQALVLGVCKTIAERFKLEAWQVRLATLILGLVWFFPVTAAYVILGFVMPETERRSRDFFRGAGILLKESAERITSTLGNLFGGSSRFKFRDR